MFASVTFLGPQRLVAQTDHIRVPLAEKTCVADVLDHLRERFPELALAEYSVLVTVNDKVSALDQVLQPEDDVAFLPFIGGG